MSYYLDTQPIAHVKAWTNSMTADTTWREAYADRDGGAPMDCRKQVILYNRSVRKIFWTFKDPGSGVAADVRECNAIDSGQYLAVNIADNIPIYVRTATGTARVIVNELG